MNAWHRQWVVASLLLLPGAWVSAQEPLIAPPKAQPWKYVSQPGPDTFARPVMSAIRLSDDKPEQMTEKAAYRGR